MASTGARIIDISVHGLGVETSRQLIPGRRYTFQLGSGEEAFAVRGLVRWSKLRGIRRSTRGETETVYHSGVALDDVLTESAQRVIALIQRVADLAPGERLFARIRPRDGDNVSVESTLGVRVTRIGARGMVVLSELTLETETLCDVTLNLEGEAFEARARVIGIEVRPEAVPDRRHRLELELVELSPASRELLDRYIADELDRRGIRSLRAPAPVAPAPELQALVGNVRSRVFHLPTCRSATGPSCTVSFAGATDALAAEFRPCRRCRPERGAADSDRLGGGGED